MKKHILTFLILICLIVVLVISLPKENKIKEYTSEEIELAIYINDEETNTIPSKDSGYYLDLEKSTCTNNAIIQFDTNTWSPVIKNMSEYKTRCELHFGSEYKESILNGTDPVLKDPLIPVTIDNDGVVRKASLANEWYSYEKKNWSNAVILFDENETYEDGEIIPEEKIESYFVWIPKYRYQLWDLGNYDGLTSIDTSKVHEIPIIFGDYNTSDDVNGECTTPMKSGATGNCTVGDYMTHPAFLSIPSTGFWVGKFETGYAGATNTADAEQNTRDASKIVVKPNVYSWRGIQAANAFYTSYDYKRDLDSHMMKNTEWGAVAYIQHSVYGSSTSVRPNNNSSYIAGYAANNEPTCGYTGTNEECNRHCNDGTCNTAYPNSTLASTTQNTSGIYDMSGGAWEYTANFMLNKNGEILVGNSLEENSFFSGILYNGDVIEGLPIPDVAYYDLYNFTDFRFNYLNRILGDATGEMGPSEEFQYLEVSRGNNSWYHDGGFFASLGAPFMPRGGGMDYGNECGVFGFFLDNGYAAFRGGFRIVLTPTGGTS